MKKHHVGLRFILAAALGVCFFDVSQAAPGLVGNWSFDEGIGDTAHDGSGLGNNGVNRGALWTAGVKGTALRFGGAGGTAKVSVPDNVSLHPASVTVEAWVYADSFKASNSGIFISKDNGAKASYRLQMHNTDGTVAFVTDNAWGNECHGATVIANRQWHHVAGVWANQTLKVYVDGQLDGSKTESGSPSFTADSLFIGYTGNNTNPFAGKIDEVKIFNYELPADSIMAHYNSVILPAAPAIPVLSAPSNNSSNVPTTLTLSWGTTAFTTWYEVQVSLSSTFGATILDQSGATLTSATAGGLTNGTTYFWRANASNAGGATWSNAWSFTTVVATPKAPVLAAPTNNAQNQPVTLNVSWGTSALATSYEVQVSLSSTFGATILDQSGATLTSATAGGLTNGTTYFWRANASNAGGTAWSSVWSFTTIVAIPGAPVLAAPTNNAQNQPVTLNVSWGTSALATSYEVQVSLSSTFGATILDQSGATLTSATAGGLTNGTTYFWRANASNAGGTAWSSVWKFTTLAIPTAPTIVAPTNSFINNVPLTVTWSSVAGATSYTIQVSIGSAFSTTTYLQAGLITSYMFMPNRGVINYCRVNVTNTAGTSGWSNVWRLTPSVAVIQTPLLRDGGYEFSMKQGMLAYFLPQSEQVEFSLCDMLGRTAMAINRVQNAGHYTIDLKNSTLSSGRYMVRFKAGTLEKRAVLMFTR